MQVLWGQGHAGGWVDLGLRQDGQRTQAGGRMVRYLHAERTISRGRQEDDGLRGGGAIELGIAGRHFLSYGRRRRFDRNVEGVRRDGAAWLDWQQASSNDLSAGFRMRSRS